MKEQSHGPISHVKKTVRYTGQHFFQDGEAIFISKSREHPLSEMHCHDFLEIAYVASGVGIHLVGDKKYAVSRGDLFIINHDMPHVFRSLCMDDKMLIVYNCGFNPDFLDPSLMDCRDFTGVVHQILFHSFFPQEGIKGADVHLSSIENRCVEELYQKMLSEFTGKESGYIELLRAYVIELIIIIFRAFQSKDHQENRDDAHRNNLVEKVMLYMQNNLSSELRIDDLSMMAFLSSNHFCKLFKDTTGMTVIEYAQKIRIDEACRLLRETRMRIIDIAAEVGYKDIKFFNQIFKRITHETPSSYRKTHGLSDSW